MADSYDAAQEFDSNASTVKNGAVRTYSTGKTAYRLIKAKKAGVSATGVISGAPINLVFLKLKLVFIAIAAGMFFLMAVSLGFSSAVTNETLHLNSAETIATDTFAFDYTGTSDEDKSLFQETFQFCNEKLNNAIRVARVKAEVKTKMAISSQFGFFSGVLIRYDPPIEQYPVQASTRSNLYIMSAYSAAMDNLLSQKAENYFNSSEIGNGIGQDIEKRLIHAADAFPSTSCMSGNILIGANYEETAREYDPITQALVSVTYQITYIGIDYNDVVSAAFGLNLSDEYDPDSHTGITYAQYIADISDASADLLGINDVSMYLGGSMPTGSIAALEGKLIWPLEEYGPECITSRFGPRNTGIQGASTNHMGVDIGAPEMTPAYAAYGGTVIISSYNQYRGNYVKIDHGNGVATIYQHLNTRGCNVGDVVRQGQCIGFVGHTGVGSGAHLHFEVKINDTNYDPLLFYGLGS